MKKWKISSLIRKYIHLKHKSLDSARDTYVQNKHKQFQIDRLINFWNISLTDLENVVLWKTLLKFQNQKNSI